MFKLPTLSKLLTLSNLLILPVNSINDDLSILDTTETANNAISKIKILYASADQFLNKRDLLLAQCSPRYHRH